jgi:hypothetical protein
MAYSDEPVLVVPQKRWSLKAVVATGLVLALVAGVLSIPLYQRHLEESAHEARRGPHHGALYELTLNGVAHELELGWIAPAFSAVLSPAPSDDTVLDVSGDFGGETLSWNAAEKRFGPGQIRLDPYAHQKVKLTLRRGDGVLWRDTLWLYGVNEQHSH